MAEFDPPTTQRAPGRAITTELAAAGFEDAREIGRGGFGVVYRCRQTALDRTVAVKVLTEDFDTDNLERFLREQRAMGQLSGHPHIVNIHQVGATSSGRPYIVMRYHACDSLDARIRRLGPIEWPEALRLGIKLAGALETAHRLGIIHRDVKPANILLTEYREPQLTDFGIARIAGGFETSTRSVLGSPAFTAPEVLSGGPPTPSSDVYGFAATLFCAITGHAAFERRSGERVIAQFLRVTTEPIPDFGAEGIPQEVCDVVERAMSGDPRMRPTTAAEFGYELQECQRRMGLSVDHMALPVELSEDGQNPLGGTLGVVSGSSRPLKSPVRRRTPTTIPPPTAAAKFRPPTPTRLLVARARLIDVLRAGRSRRLTVIHAPAGFGKSTLAAQWRDVLTEDGVAVAWLGVDHDDDNVVWFLAHLVEAIRKISPALGDGLGEALEQRGDAAAQYVMISLINEVHDSGQRVAVVLDDWHRVTSAETITAMEFLLDHGCHHLPIIVTSRTRTGLPLSRMRVCDELVEIDSAALRFDAAESYSFLVDLGGLTLDRGDVDALTRSTDGWVAALQLASLSLRGCDDPTQLISHLSGRHHAIGEFLAENVLETLEPRLLEFLMATSITGRICGSLASALARVERGQAMLEDVESRDLFLRRLDDDGDWFRYHHLFAEYLRRRLERDQPERIGELHAAASRWFADRQLLSEAVNHALAAGDEKGAVDMVEHDGTVLLEHAKMSTLLGLVAKLPPRLVVSSARLQLTLAWAHCELQRVRPAQAALDRVYSLLERDAMAGAEIADLRVEADVVQGDITIFSDRIDGVDELMAECLSRPETLPPWVVSAAADIATFAEVYRFDFDAARRMQDWASTYHERTSGPYSGAWGYCYYGIAANEQLDVVAAEYHFRKAMRLAVKSGGRHSHAARLASALLGELLYERGDLATAERLLNESRELGYDVCVDFMLAPCVVGAHIMALRGDRDGAANRLDEGAEAAESRSLPRFRARIDNERVMLGLPLEPGRAVEFAERRHPVDGLDEITAQLEDATAITLLLGRRSAETTAAACTWAGEWVHRIEGRGRHRALLHANRLLVGCLAAAGRNDEAKQVLASIAAQCAERDMIRYLLDGGPYVMSTLRGLRDDQLHGLWRPEWTTVPTAFLEALSATTGPTLI
ncbi:serine/threonine-protein kinase [Rhodococcus sp. JS3073]|uniref:serine/threonine-protein kinase n=1 Tax=Rhodococcus sp. JS3073 TaxID=3002901 RepID=UPI002285A041|nr:serine/threonine-protein kinase [Rhodococcus sp. JS3073]WAM15385.1 protein kinase [Rhodococcus sp. JS3073]